MLINKPAEDNRVQFVEYTGQYPNQCSGHLTLEICGALYKFAPAYHKVDGAYDTFWHATESEWETDYEKLPDELKEFANEIDEAFCANVGPCHCGGCS